MVENYLTGFIWVVTENGVFRYEGVRFRELTPEHGLQASVTASIGESPDGSVLVPPNGSEALFKEARRRRRRRRLATAVAVLVAADDVPPADVAGAVEAARAAGATRVLRAGRPARDAQADWTAAGVDDFVYIGVDALAVLQQTHDDLGVEA